MAPWGLGAIACRSMSPNELGSPKQAIQMLTDRVLVQVPRSEGERKSKSGILIPATAEIPRRLSWAEVVATGPQVRSIKAGDQVLFSPEDRFEVEVQGDNYLILRERDVEVSGLDYFKVGMVVTPVMLFAGALTIWLML